MASVKPFLSKPGNYSNTIRASSHINTIQIQVYVSSLFPVTWLARSDLRVLVSGLPRKGVNWIHLTGTVHELYEFTFTVDTHAVLYCTANYRQIQSG